MRTKTSATGDNEAWLGRSAFTLIEVIVVVALLAVAAGLIVPRMGASVEHRELEEVAVRFAHTARTVRELAVSRQQNCCIEIDLDAGGYAISIASEQSGSGSMIPVQASWLKSQRWPKSIRVSEFRTPEGQVSMYGRQRLTFMPDGTSSGGSIRLASGQNERVIVVYPHNGRVVSGAPETLSMSQDYYDLGD